MSEACASIKGSSINASSLKGSSTNGPSITGLGTSGSSAKGPSINGSSGIRVIELGSEPIQDFPSTSYREKTCGTRFVELGGEPAQDVLMRFCNGVHQVRV